jgi:hypothetical protein
LLGYKEVLHMENLPLGESQVSASGGTEGRSTETVAVMLGGESTKCSTWCSNFSMSMLVAL